ncbi:MAG: hypothetical protein GF315_00860 [candidate division Zixibacteria bacterium]|nr:hypothetical protein [candidate division Zixibacteria bacterium]
MIRYLISLIFIFVTAFPFPANAELIGVTLNGADFSPFSKGCLELQKDGKNFCLLTAISNGEYAIYNFEFRADAERISASADIENPSGREIDVYIYNYGDRRETDLLSKPELSDRWIRWETVLVDEHWESRSPQFMTAKTEGGAIDLLGPYNIVRLLFYADPGVPPQNEVFIIKEVTLTYETAYDFASVTKSDTSKVWRDGDKLYAYGIGYPPSNVSSQGQARAMAIRAGTVDAQRNLLFHIKSITSSGTDGRVSISGRLTGAVTEDTEYFDDGSVRITLSIPIKRIFQ